MRLGLLLRVRDVCEQTPFVLSLSKDLYPTKFAKLENRHSGRDCRNPGHKDVKMKIMCRCRDDYFNVGSRTHGRDTFFCFAKRKCPKKRRPGCRLLPALLAFTRGCQKGLPCPFDNTRYPYRVPNGLYPINAPMLGAAYGSCVVIVGWGKLCEPQQI
jgi:hypothetical protein